MTPARPSSGRVQALAWGGLLAVSVAGVAASFHVLVGRPTTLPPVVAGCVIALAVGAVVAVPPQTARHAARLLRLTFVAAGLTTCVLCTYLVIVVGLAGTPHGTERRVLALSMVAAVVAVLLVEPVRDRLLEVAARWSHDGGRRPTTALETFGARMTRSVPMDELLLQLAETLKDTIGPAGVEIWTGTAGRLELTVAVPDRPRPRIDLSAQDAGVVARARAAGNAWVGVWLPALLDGRTDQQVRVAPVAHLGELLGLIVVCRAAGAPAYDEVTDGVLSDLARQVGLALHNVRLDSALQASLEELRQRNEELQASRARIVAASDESRRRIERNLHDGAQQHLVALAVKLGLARQLLGDASPATSTLLEELRSDVQTTIDELRELAHGIYPPLLRDRGLPEALATAGSRCPLPVTVDVRTRDRYPADVEAAVYFCCLEALQNAAKHAGPDATVSVTVEADEAGLRFCVHDTGPGFDTSRFVGGHGFTNMTDRLGAMGGRLEVRSDAGHGTSIGGAVPCSVVEVSPRAAATAPGA